MIYIHFHHRKNRIKKICVCVKQTTKNQIMSAAAADGGGCEVVVDNQACVRMPGGCAGGRASVANQTHNFILYVQTSGRARKGRVVYPGRTMPGVAVPITLNAYSGAQLDNNFNRNGNFTTLMMGNRVGTPCDSQCNFVGMIGGTSTRMTLNPPTEAFSSCWLAYLTSNLRPTVTPGTLMRERLSRENPIRPVQNVTNVERLQVNTLLGQFATYALQTDPARFVAMLEGAKVTLQVIPTAQGNDMAGAGEEGGLWYQYADNNGFRADPGQNATVFEIVPHNTTNSTHDRVDALVSAGVDINTAFQLRLVSNGHNLRIAGVLNAFLQFTDASADDSQSSFVANTRTLGFRVSFVPANPGSPVQLPMLPNRTTYGVANAFMSFENSELPDALVREFATAVPWIQMRCCMSGGRNGFQTSAMSTAICAKLVGACGPGGSFECDRFMQYDWCADAKTREDNPLRYLNPRSALDANGNVPSNRRAVCACFNTVPADSPTVAAVMTGLQDANSPIAETARVCVNPSCANGEGYQTQAMRNTNCPPFCTNVVKLFTTGKASVIDANIDQTMVCGSSGNEQTYSLAYNERLAAAEEEEDENPRTERALSSQRQKPCGSCGSKNKTTKRALANVLQKDEEAEEEVGEVKRVKTSTTILVYVIGILLVLFGALILALAAERTPNTIAAAVLLIIVGLGLIVTNALVK